MQEVLNLPDKSLGVIAIVGRPNVGKSTLFNRMTRTRDAIVGDCAGVTRDRQYGVGVLNEKRHWVIDTGGLFADSEFRDLVDSQVMKALDEANIIFFVVDAKDGLCPKDQIIAQKLRALNKSVYCVINKLDTGDPESLSAEFYTMGFENVFKISAEHNKGVRALLTDALADYKVVETPELKDDAISVAVVGKPNVGKSTLINRILGEERLLVFDKPGTTLDSVVCQYQHFDQKFKFIDTAGIRRKSVVTEKLEKFSIVKTLDALDACHVALVMVDAKESLSDQDLRLLNYAIQSGRAIILCLNKWDNLTKDHKESLQKQLQYRLRAHPYVKVQPISALHGSNVGLLFEMIQTAYKQASVELSTPKLNDLLQQAQMRSQPPLVNGRRIKLRMAHSGGKFPPTIVIHGNQTEKVPMNYKRYLARFFMDGLKLHSTPVKIIFKTSDNPYKHKKNILTPKQLKKRGRLIKNRIEKSKRKRRN